jgi:hypothetical protein
MNRAMNALLLGAVCLWTYIGTLAAAEAPTLTVTLSEQEIRVGDLVEATLTLDLDDGAGEPSFPNWQRHWGAAEIREIGEVTRAELGGSGTTDSKVGARYSQRLVLTSFRPGTVTLPSATVSLAAAETTVEVAAEPATFEVGSVLPVGEEQLEPKPPVPPRALPLGDRFWWTAGLLAVLTAGLLALILTRRREQSTTAVELIDPWQQLEQALARLATAADPETVFTGLSLELRRYLGHCLAFPAAESTTTELRRRLLRSGLPAGVCGDVVRLLVEADTVKFARKIPSPGRVSECLEQTRGAATEVRSFLQREAAAEEGEEAA